MRGFDPDRSTAMLEGLSPSLARRGQGGRPGSPPRRRSWPGCDRSDRPSGTGRPRALRRRRIRASSASNIWRRTSPRRPGAEASRRPPSSSAGSRSVIDGQGTADGIRRALQQAIALQPNGIVLASVDAQSNVGLMKEAERRGHQDRRHTQRGQSGPGAGGGLFTNVTCEPKKQGTLGASTAIADAKGTAQTDRCHRHPVCDRSRQGGRGTGDNQGLPDVQDARICQHAGWERQSEHAGILHLLDTEISRSLLRLHGDRRRFLRPGRAGVAHRRRSADRADRLDRLRRQPRRLPAHSHGNL